MYKIEADKARNLLILHLEGFMSDDELKKGAEEVMRKSDTLKDGFVVINDISKMKPASQGGAEEIKKAQQYVVQRGMGRIIRVTSDPISSMQFNRTSKSVGYIAETAGSMEEALKMVAQPDKMSI